MPNNRNAAKSMRQSARRRLRNRSVKSSLRTIVKKVRVAAEGSDPQAAEAAFRTAVKRLDQAAAHKYIHRNKAARLKSRLDALVHKKG
jgi:small subunit ribosomal protein S20